MFCRSLFVLFLSKHYTEGQTIQWSKEKEQTMIYKHYTEGQTIQWSKDKEQTMIYKTLHRRTDVFCVVFCRSLFFLFWPLYCLSFCVMFCISLFDLFLLTIVLSVLHDIQNITQKDRQYMAKRNRSNNDIQNITQKDRQYNGQKKKNKQWSTNITQKDRQYNALSFDHCIVCPSV
jgi:hypothetical protein